MYFKNTKRENNLTNFIRNKIKLILFISRFNYLINNKIIKYLKYIALNI